MKGRGTGELFPFGNSINKRIVRGAGLIAMRTNEREHIFKFCGFGFVGMICVLLNVERNAGRATATGGKNIGEFF